jgi:hypothetical protein
MSGRFPGWLADWLGVSTPSGDGAATWSLDSAWDWAPWATVVLGLGAVLWTGMLYARESSSAGKHYRTLLAMLRLATIAIVLIMLAQWALAVRLTGPPSIALTIDRSASMGVVDRYNDPALASRIKERLRVAGLAVASRLNLAKQILTADDGRSLRILSDSYRLEVYLAAAGVERVTNAAGTAKLAGIVRGLSSDGAESQASRLGDAVSHVLDDLRGATPAAVILLSDGVTTDGVPLAEAAQDARRRGVPLFTVGLGSADAPRDIELTDLLVDEVVFVNDLVSVQAQIKSSGLEGESAQVTLRREGDSTPLEQETVTLPPAGQTLNVRLADRPTEPGEVNYVVELAVRDDETDPQNNRQARNVAVRDEKIRVLLAQGYPNYEFRFLKTLLERDPTVKLSTYLQDADPEYSEQDKTALQSFPIGREELFEYDVLVIGDVDPRLLPQSVWQNIKAFVVEKGGGAAFLAGPRFLPWLYRDNPNVKNLLPIDVDGADGGTELPADVTRGFVVRPTRLGLQNPAMQLGDTPVDTERIWESLAPLYWLYESQSLKPAAQVFAEGPQSSAGQRSAVPVICFQYVGPGGVLFHAIDSTWRWRIGGGQPVYARYWVQTIRFLARGKLTGGRGVQLTADRREYRRGESVQLRARFLDSRLAPTGNEVTVFVDSSGQPRRRVTLARNTAMGSVFETTLTDLPAGQYEVIVAEPQIPGNPITTRFSVLAPPGEFARTEMDAAGLRAAAEVSRGRFFTIENVDQLLNDLPAGRREPIENLPPISIWNRWWLLAAFVGCITAEWILRKRKGML